MRTYLTIATTALLIAGIAVSIAVAAPAEKDTFVSEFTFEDTWTCAGTTIVQSNVERDTIIEFANGVLHIQRHGLATLEANDKTLTSNFSAMIFLDLNQPVVRVAGTVYNIQIPGAGNVLLDAGNIAIDESSNPPTIVHLAGPHQQFTGDVDELCTYFGAP